MLYLFKYFLFNVQPFHHHFQHPVTVAYVLQVIFYIARLYSLRDIFGVNRRRLRFQGSLQRFVGSGCVNAANSGPAGSPRTCGPALATVQQDLRTLVAAVGR